MNSFNKAQADIFPIQTMLPENSLFSDELNKPFISILFSEPDYPYLDALGPFQPLQMKVQSVLHSHWFLCRDNDLYDKQP